MNNKSVGIWKIGECDWFIAESREKAIEAAKDYMDEVEELIENDFIERVSEEELDSLKYFFGESDNSKFISFRDRMNQILSEGSEINCVFASAEY